MRARIIYDAPFLRVFSRQNARADARRRSNALLAPAPCGERSYPERQGIRGEGERLELASAREDADSRE